MLAMYHPKSGWIFTTVANFLRRLSGSPDNMHESSVHQNLFNSLNCDKISILTGNNGTGKSRFFEMVSSTVSEDVQTGSSKFSQLVCFSGTHNDKYPRSVWSRSIENDKISYLGYRVGNNMISDIAPFRKIIHSILNIDFDALADQSVRNIDAIKYCLEKIGISSTINLRLRYGKNKKSELSGYISSDVPIDLLEIHRIEKRSEIISHLHDGSLSVQTLSVDRMGSSFLLADLSSGERAYMIALFGAMFCVKPEALVLFDEPENSLHPAWQKSIIPDFQEVFKRRQISVTTVLATHSPLIASSPENKSTFTCNFPSEQAWHPSDLNGKTSDAALKDQFDIYSSRSPEVIRLVQRILKFISKGDVRSPELLSSIDVLISYELAPAPGDPLHNILRTLKHVRQNNELP